MMKRSLTFAMVTAACVVAATPDVASAQTWASWALPGQCGSPVAGGLATYTGTYNAVQDASGARACGTISENGGGNNFWAPALPYSPTPNNISFIQFNVAGGTNVITFNQAVVDPYIALISVGQPGVGVTYAFNDDFSVVSSNTVNAAYWGTGSYSMPNSSTLLGNEFSGVLQFTGTFNAGDAIEFSVRTNEYWHGFTVGAASVVPEPASFALVMTGVLAMGVAGAKRRMKVR